MSTNEKYAIITASHNEIGEINIRVDRYVPMKELIFNLFEALNCDKQKLKGYYSIAEKSHELILPNESLADKAIYDGEVIRIL
jgi:uncharacterized ubiquitin-like protein YukD